ncbi:BatA domain-containing protein [Thermostilla marina]
MAGFAYPFFLWALGLVAVPVIIHLINLFRRRRVPWAAMEFLLAAKKRNQRKILLKQWLLLLLRMAVLALLALFVAQPLAGDWWGNLGSGTKHVIVLLDDSYSMSDQAEGVDAWENAKQTVRQIALAASRDRSRSLVTILRFSQASFSEEERTVDFYRQAVGTETLTRITEFLESVKPTAGAYGPAEALNSAARWCSESPTEGHIVYVVSDFRRRNYIARPEVQESLAELDSADATVRFVRVVDRAHPNLTVTNVRLIRENIAVDVPFDIAVEVRNQSQDEVRNVLVRLQTDEAVLPAATIDRIPPAGTAEVRTTMAFRTAGTHTVTASLESDAVATDNAYFAAIHVPKEIRVLLVDASPAGESAKYVAAALAPGGEAGTGIVPQVETPRAIEDLKLNQFDAVFLLDWDVPTPSTARALSEYAAEGGGVCLFIGERADLREYTRLLYECDHPVMPVPLLGPRDLPIDRLRAAPDVLFSDHPIFAAFRGMGSTFLNTVRVLRYVEVDTEKTKSGAKVIAELRNGAPLAYEFPVGKGKVIVFLTTAAPIWNNWARGNPSFVITMLELQRYLHRGSSQAVVLHVGQRPRFLFRLDRWQPVLRWEPPAELGRPPQTIPPPQGTNATQLELPRTTAQGIYRLCLVDISGNPQEQAFAVNVDPEEGDMTLLEPGDIAQEFGNLVDAFIPASEATAVTEDRSGTPARAVLYLLIVFLLLEQAAARWTSYHPGEPVAAGGPRR